MNLNEVQQVVETIKTLNINFNDATTQKIADAIIPVVKMYIIRSYISMGLVFLGLIIFISITALLIWKIIKYYNSAEVMERRVKEIKAREF